MVIARLCETAGLAISFASPRHFDFSHCDIETSKCFAGVRARDVQTLKI